MYWLIPICFLALIEANYVNIAAKHVNIAAVGDSITYADCWIDGNKHHTVDNPVPGYPPLTPYTKILKDLLGDDKTYTIKNFGANGHTMMKNSDASYWSSTAYKDAIAFKPDIVILMLGTNDAKQRNWNQPAFE